MISCPQCRTVNYDGVLICKNCGAPLPKRTMSPLRLGLYVGCAALIIIGVLFVWAAPVANTTPRLIVGTIMIALGIIFILLLRRRGTRSKHYPQEEVEGIKAIDLSQLKCKACGASLSEDTIMFVNDVPKLVCPKCKEPYKVEEEPKW